MPGYMDHEAGRCCLLGLANALEAVGVEYFLIQGTALGAVRDGGFTPTEQDIDLGVLYEEFRADLLLEELGRRGFAVECVTAPFTRVRTIVARRDGAKADIVSFARWGERRFAATPVLDWIIRPYAIVHEAALLERRQEVEMFGRRFQIPSPVETYLEREYGLDWRIPAEDHVSRARVYDFLALEGVPLDHLEH